MDGSRKIGSHNRSLSTTSPTKTPSYPQTRHPSVGISTVKRTQNVAAKAAAQRLAQVMATQVADDEEDDDDDDMVAHRAPAHHRHRSISTTLNNGRISTSQGSRYPSPALGRNSVEHITSVRSASDGRPSLLIRTTPTPPISKESTLITPRPITPVETANSRMAENRFTPVSRPLSPNDRANQVAASTIHDELDMLRKENTNIVDKICAAKERRKLAENKAIELEKQVASLGEGVSMESEFLCRKEEELQRREASKYYHSIFL